MTNPRNGAGGSGPRTAGLRASDAADLKAAYGGWGMTARFAALRLLRGAPVAASAGYVAHQGLQWLQQYL